MGSDPQQALGTIPSNRTDPEAGRSPFHISPPDPPMTSTAARSRCRPAAGAAVLGLAALLAGLGGSAAQAQMLLYENRLPDGFAYVRFANTTPDALTVKPDGFADTVALGTDGGARVSPYYTVEKVAGRTLALDLTAKGVSGHAAFQIKPGAFHTVLLGPGGKAQVVTDEAEINQSRARLAFYNAEPDCGAAGLQLEPSGTSVFSAVAAGSMKGRSVNPIAKAHVKAGCGMGRTVPLDLGELSAGGQYSIWLMAPAGAPVAFMSENAIAPYLR